MRNPFRRRPAEVSPETFVAFLRAGKPCALAEWAALDDVTRVALEVAGDRVFGERVALFAALLRGAPEAVDEVSRLVDDGQSADEARVSAHLTALLSGAAKVNRG